MGHTSWTLSHQDFCSGSCITITWSNNQLQQQNNPSLSSLRISVSHVTKTIPSIRHQTESKVAWTCFVIFLLAGLVIRKCQIFICLVFSQFFPQIESANCLLCVSKLDTWQPWQLGQVTTGLIYSSLYIRTVPRGTSPFPYVLLKQLSYCLMLPSPKDCWPHPTCPLQPLISCFRKGPSYLDALGYSLMLTPAIPSYGLKSHKADLIVISPISPPPKNLQCGTLPNWRELKKNPTRPYKTTDLSHIIAKIECLGLWDLLSSICSPYCHSAGWCWWEMRRKSHHTNSMVSQNWKWQQ